MTRMWIVWPTEGPENGNATLATLLTRPLGAGTTVVPLPGPGSEPANHSAAPIPAATPLLGTSCAVTVAVGIWIAAPTPMTRLPPPPPTRRTPVKLAGVLPVYVKDRTP